VCDATRAFPRLFSCEPADEPLLPASRFPGRLDSNCFIGQVKKGGKGCVFGYRRECFPLRDIKQFGSRLACQWDERQRAVGSPEVDTDAETGCRHTGT